MSRPSREIFGDCSILSSVAVRQSGRWIKAPVQGLSPATEGRKFGVRIPRQTDNPPLTCLRDVATANPFLSAIGRVGPGGTFVSRQPGADEGSSARA